MFYLKHKYKQIMIFLLPVIIAVVIFILYNIISKNKQREKLIEKGINPDGISIMEYQKYTNLTNAILLISLGLGIIFAYFIRSYFNLDEFLMVYLSSLMIFGGCGYLINYLMYRKK